METSLVGREPELRRVDELLASVSEGAAALLIEGEAGIGKTTVWSAGLEAARQAGLGALVCQGARAEVKLGYAALTDLLADVDEGAFAKLPAPQRSALGAATLRAEPPGGTPPDPRAVATGFLTLLEQLAESDPILVAIDELQWLDRSSARALRFAARRLAGRVGLLLVRRNPPEPSPEDEVRLRDPERLRVLELGPLAPEQIYSLLRERTGHSVAPPALSRIDGVAAGNPFVALEVARALAGSGHAEGVALPESLRELVAARLSGLDDEVLDALLLTAELSRPRVATIQATLEAGDAGELLGQAEEAEIVTIDGGRVAFTHPVLASGVSADATPAQRRSAHRRLAAVVDGQEERARHLALASVDAQPDVIAALDAAARLARSRGAPADAAELLSLAFDLGAEEPGRLIAAAESHFAAGDLDQAGAHAERAVSALEPGPERSRALGVIGTVRLRDNSYDEAAELLERARDEAGDGAARVMLALTLAYVLTNSGRLPDAPRYAASALAEAERLGDRGLLAEALAVDTMVRFLLGEGVDEPALERALELEDPERPTPIVITPTLLAAHVLGWTGRFERALVALDEARRRCLDRGAETELVHVTAYTTTMRCAAGELERARELIDDANERASQLGTAAARGVALGNEASLASWTGDAERARSCARESLELLESIGASAQKITAAQALGRVELSLARYEAAAEILVPAYEAVRAMGIEDPAASQLAPDTLEALLALGLIEQARPIEEWLSERAEALGRPQVVSLAARCRGLLHGAEGDLEGAEAALEQALGAHEREPIAYDRARSLLAMGQIRRRRRRRRAARESLEEGREIFERLGASLWSARCEAEFGRLGRPGTADTDELTPSERRVAELAAMGQTNREVAAALFISPKTVEANLSRVYRKLGIHSRAELGASMGRDRPAA